MAAKLRVGIVGLGQRGLQHLEALWRIPRAQVVALCDPFPENLAEEKLRRFVPGFSLSGVATSNRFEQLLETGLDAVYFCIPPGRHQGELVRAAEQGLHIFAEKPVSLFLDEALEMERAIRRAGVVGTVGFQQRHDSWHLAIRDFLRDKRLVMLTQVTNGTLESHSIKHTRTEEMGGPANRVWAANFAWSGSTVVEAGIHPLDLMRFWAGEVVWVRANYIPRAPEDIVDGGDNPCGYTVTFGFESGAVATLNLTRLRQTFWGDSYQDIAWDHGHLKIEAEGPVAYYYDGPYPPPEGKVDQSALRHVLPTPPRGDTTLAIGQAFVEAARSGDTSPLLNTFASSMNSHSAVLGANVSHQLGGEKVELGELLHHPKYAAFRKKP
ncbi:MAG: Gfo/Idh/MocA family oxidoreductase [Candidatus Latescibacteria bacterium]|nr:Gfo/Idh/MocA family oxidoreductase [Candidatus Latescibacterota bacterium]